MSSIDVIVPCYRYGHFLSECVESVLTQDVSDLRVLILDDASPDDTPEVAEGLSRRDSRVTVRRHSSNKGHIATYNEGIAWVSATYMLLLSADDYLLPGALGRSVALMSAHPEVAFTFGNYITVTDDGVTRSKHVLGGGRDRILTGREFMGLNGSRNPVCTPTAVVRTELQKRVGGYRPELPHSGDMEMWLRLAARGAVGFVADHQAAYRLHATNMSSAYMAGNLLPDVEQRAEALTVFFENDGANLPNAKQLRRKVLRSLALDALRLASGAFNEGATEESSRLCEFAVDLCPEIRGSLPWVKLAAKRRVGRRAWCHLREIAARVRRTGGDPESVG